MHWCDLLFWATLVFVFVFVPGMQLAHERLEAWLDDHPEWRAAPKRGSSAPRPKTSKGKLQEIRREL